jgi:hypothetical protein
VCEVAAVWRASTAALRRGCSAELRKDVNAERCAANTLWHSITTFHLLIVDECNPNSTHALASPEQGSDDGTFDAIEVLAGSFANFSCIFAFEGQKSSMIINNYYNQLTNMKIKKRCTNKRNLNMPLI